MTQRNTLVPIAKPYLGIEETQAVEKVLNSNWLSQGPEVALFEHEFAEKVHAKYACAVSSCTTALHLALYAAGIGTDDEVITVSHSFIATANAIRYCRAVPVFVDVEPDSSNIDPTLIEQAITNKSKAILCVHQLGMPCNLAAILQIARNHNLLVIEDAACAIGSEIFIEDSWQKIGKPHGDIACFSFHPRKLLTAGEGGMLTTNSPLFDKQFRSLRQHDMSVSADVRHDSKSITFEGYSDLGFNYRMTDIQAAIGRVQLGKLDRIVKRQRQLASRYSSILSQIPDLRIPTEPSWSKTNWQSFYVGLPDGVDQLAVMQSLLNKNISTRRGVMCAHREPAFANRTDWTCIQRGNCECNQRTCKQLLQSEYLQDKNIILPMYFDMTKKDQSLVADVLHKEVLRFHSRDN